MKIKNSNKLQRAENKTEPRKVSRSSMKITQK